MAGFVDSVSRDQTTLFPDRPDGWIGEADRIDPQQAAQRGPGAPPV